MDREKVIKGIECHRKKIQTTKAVSCLECPYSEPNPIREWCMSGLMDDIYSLLKEQEAVKPYIDIDEAKCPICKVKLTRQELLGDDVLFEDFFDYCPHCGRKVKWDG